MNSTMSDKLLDELLQSSLILAEDWDNLPAKPRLELLDERDYKVLLQKLVREQLLTQYQADRIEAGKIRGLILGNYRVLGRLGAGGMGVVFLGEHIRLRRQVAIKVMAVPCGENTSRLLISRFLTEIRAIAQIQHPNIVWAIDTGEVQGHGDVEPTLYYHVMEFVPGQNLEDMVLARGPMSVSAACDVIYQVASALAEADKHQLVHRDIKPSNILVTPKGQAKLLDFGLARHFAHRLTQTGAVLGTIEYLAPEQALDARSVDIRADIYGLGGTLFWCLTGRPPFHSSAPLAQQLLNRIKQQPPSLLARYPDMPAALDGIIAKMMATSPENRYSTPDAVMHVLLPFLRPVAREVAAPAPSPQSPPSVGSATLSSEMEAPVRPRPQVLLADDDDMTRSLCQHALVSSGIDCREVTDGLAVWPAIKERACDLVVLSVDLPRIGAVELLRQLREAPWPNMKIVVTARAGFAEDMAKLMQAGADDFLCKPFSMIELTVRVQALLRLKTAQDHSDSLAGRLLESSQLAEERVHSAEFELRVARHAFVRTLSEIVLTLSTESQQHLERMQRYVRVLSDTLLKAPHAPYKIDEAFLRTLEEVVPLHDIGMIGLPEHLVQKPGKLAPDEHAIMQMHTTLGAEILEKGASVHHKVPAFLQMAIDVARAHHERWDGTGYPERRAGQNIPLAARLVAIADVYDALRSRRPHKPPLMHDAAKQLIVDASGKQFDPALIVTFLECADRFKEIFQPQSESGA